MIRYSVIGGYLGAGKTTLLNRILQHNQGARFGLIVNDFGALNIDAELIESRTDSQVNLTNGCVCCTLVDGFHEALETVAAAEPDHIIVEASGVADVANIAQFGHGPNLVLDPSQELFERHAVGLSQLGHALHLANEYVLQINFV